MENIFTGDKQVIRQSFNQLPQLLQNYICYLTWLHKGKIMGIHNDLGRHSYLQSNEVGQYYHLNDEDRINLLLSIQETFQNL